MSQTTQIDQALHTGGFSSQANIAGRGHIPLVEINPTGHTVHQVIGSCDVLHGGCERFRRQNITSNNLHLVTPRPPLQSPRITNETANAIATSQQMRNQPSANVAGGSCYQNQARILVFCHSFLLSNKSLRPDRPRGHRHQYHPANSRRFASPAAAARPSPGRCAPRGGT